VKVTKPIDLDLLERELIAAGVPVNGLGHTGTDTDGEVYTYTTDVPGDATELPPEAQPVVDAHDPTKPQRAAAFEQAEDAERLALVNERARQDAAFAALADLTLSRLGVQT